MCPKPCRWGPRAHLLDTAGVVDGNHIQEAVGAAVPAAQEVASNAAEAVDGHLQLLLGHGHLLGGLHTYVALPMSAVHPGPRMTHMI